MTKTGSCARATAASPISCPMSPTTQISGSGASNGSSMSRAPITTAPSPACARGFRPWTRAFRRAGRTMCCTRWSPSCAKGEEVKLSKRAGSYVTLRDLIDEVGCDATRYFLVARGPSSQLTFDIDLALSQSNDNPVYYIQYAHARACSVHAQTGGTGLGVAIRKRANPSGPAGRRARKSTDAPSGSVPRSRRQRRHSAMNLMRLPTTCASWPASSTPATTPTRCW